MPAAASLVDIGSGFPTDATTDDPDQRSPTLRRFHQLLWSKSLPSDHFVGLDTTTPWVRAPQVRAWRFFLSSDSVVAIFRSWASTAAMISQLPRAEVEALDAIGYTVGAMMLFPGNKVDGTWTINMARGMIRRLADRMDLTLECVRCYYPRRHVHTAGRGPGTLPGVL